MMIQKGVVWSYYEIGLPRIAIWSMNIRNREFETSNMGEASKILLIDFGHTPICYPNATLQLGAKMFGAVRKENL